MKRPKVLIYRHWKTLILLTPNVIKKVFKNRFFIILFTLAIGGIIGNHFDRLTVTGLKWIFEKSEYYNIFIVLFFLTLIFLIWILIAFIRLNDYRIYSPGEKYNFIMRQSSDEFYTELTKIITTSEYKSELLISIGEGESLNDWLMRVFEESKSGRINYPQISNIHIKMLSPDLCNTLESNNCLSKGFSKRMNENIDKFINNSNLKELGIGIRISYWDKLPSFHGFIYDKRCFVNSWEVNRNNVLHVRTPLKEFTAKEHSNEYNAIIKDFET